MNLSVQKSNPPPTKLNSSQSESAKDSGAVCNGDSSSQLVNGDGEIEREKVVQLSEDDLQLFAHQVAGHGTAEKGLLKHKLGYVLKPLQGPPKGTREVDFYHRVFSPIDPTSCYTKLQEFVPKFHGIANLPPSQDSDHSPSDPKRYLMLDDAIQGFKKPCVMDLKLGPQTWSPDATEAKINQEKSKYKGTKLTIGICLTGMIYYDVGKNYEVCKTSRETGKSLVPETMKEAIKTFFNHRDNSTTSKKSSILVKLAQGKLQRIKQVFDTQKSFRLYGSSVLIAYDAEYFESEAGENDSVPIRVFMIDFAHFHSGEYESVDENYLFGLANLLQIVCDIGGNK